MTPLREKLFSLYKQALHNQTYPHWEVLLLGEEEGRDEKFIKLRTKEEWKINKLQEALDYIQSLEQKPDYVIRLDDDDLIAPALLEKASKLDFDCYGESHHHFYDLVYSKYSCQKRPWLTNTVIHKTEHIFVPYGPEQIPLLKKNHNEAWHIYYQNKKLVLADKNDPMYLRLLSPTTFSVHGFDFEKNQTNDWAKYNKYLHSFGLWKNKMNVVFVPFEASLKELAAEFQAPPRQQQPLLTRIKKFIRE
jgi:glycosyltransferase involved in cell wall biosynthesis